MNEPDKPKLTDYLTEALAKSLTEEGRQSLLEERELVEAEAQRERLEALQIQTRPLDAPEVGEEARPRRLLRYAPNHGPTRFSRSRYPSGSIQLGRPAGSPSGESSTLTKTCRRMGNCPYSRLRKVLASPCSSSWTAMASPPWPRAEARPWNWPSTSARAS